MGFEAILSMPTYPLTAGVTSTCEVRFPPPNESKSTRQSVSYLPLYNQDSIPYSWRTYLILSWWGLSVSMTILSSSEMSSLCASNITTIKSAL